MVSCSVLLEARITFVPSLYKSVASCFPMPLLAPVTRTTFPWNTSAFLFAPRSQFNIAFITAMSKVSSET